MSPGAAAIGAMAMIGPRSDGRGAWRSGPATMGCMRQPLSTMAASPSSNNTTRGRVRTGAGTATAELKDFLFMGSPLTERYVVLFMTLRNGRRFRFIIPQQQVCNRPEPANKIAKSLRRRNEIGSIAHPMTVISARGAKSYHLRRCSICRMTRHLRLGTMNGAANQCPCTGR